MTTKQLAKIIQFISIVAPIIYNFDGFDVGWMRDVGRNRDVEGHPESRHIGGTAIDVGFYSMNDRDIAYELCYEEGLHGYKKEWDDWVTGGKVYGFHIQLEEPRP